MKGIAVGDVDRAIGDRQAAYIAHERVVVSSDQIKPDSTGDTEVTKDLNLQLRVALKPCMVKFCDIAVHDDAVKLLYECLKGTCAPRAAGAAEMEIAEDQGSWDAGGTHQRTLEKVPSAFGQDKMRTQS